MRRACERPGCDGQVADGSKARFCAQTACKRERARQRKELERTRGYNALIRVVCGSDAGWHKRQTASPTDEDGNELDTWNNRGGGTSWDQISEAWQRPTVSAGPAILKQRSPVDRLMEQAERRVRPVHQSAGAPVGQLRQPWRLDTWLDLVDLDEVGHDRDKLGLRTRTTHREGTGEALCPGVPDDTGTSLGERWIREQENLWKASGIPASFEEWRRARAQPSDKEKFAAWRRVRDLKEKGLPDTTLMGKATASSKRLADSCDGKPTGYLEGGTLWDGMALTLSPSPESRVPSKQEPQRRALPIIPRRGVKVPETLDAELVKGDARNTHRGSNRVDDGVARAASTARAEPNEDTDLEIAIEAAGQGLRTRQEPGFTDDPHRSGRC